MAPPYSAATPTTPCTWTNGCCDRHPRSRECCKLNRRRCMQTTSTAGAGQHHLQPAHAAAVDNENDMQPVFHDGLAEVPMLTSERSPSGATDRRSCGATIVMTENRALRPSAYWTKAIAQRCLPRAKEPFICSGAPA